MQRGAIARALMIYPTVIIADEPTAHLDIKLSRKLMGIIASLKADERKTMIIASHESLVYDSEIGDRIVEMRGLPEYALNPPILP